MDYFLVALSDVCVAGQFTFNKLYQKRVVDSTGSLLLFPVITGIIAVFLFLCLNGFSLVVGGFSLAIAAVEALVLTLCMLCGIFVVKLGSVAVYTVFMMLGGMFLPYLYGAIFLQEALSPYKIIGMVVLIGALFLSVAPEKREKKEKPKAMFYLLCLAVFCLNGSISILSKVHQINPAAIATMDYMIWLYAFQLVISSVCYGAYMLFFRRKKQAADDADGIAVEAAAADLTVDAKAAVKRRVLLAVLISGGYMLMSGFGYLLQLNAAITLPASMLYPLVTGGSVLLSTIAARIIFKEKINLFTWISLALTLVGTILFVF